jgi:hypothetical protein
MLTKRGLTRKHIKTDLDQTFFLMGMVLARKNLISELETGNLKLKKSVQNGILSSAFRSSVQGMFNSCLLSVTVIPDLERLIPCRTFLYS